MAAMRLLAGVCVLFLGRRLFWLFVGIVGFGLGAELATRFFGGQPESVLVLIALAGGVVGALLALWMQALMIAIAGLITGSYIGVQLLFATMPDPGPLIWVALVTGGLIGVLLARTLFDVGVMVLSSLLGASVIVETLNAKGRGVPLIFLALVALGIGVQARLGQPRRPV